MRCQSRHLAESLCVLDVYIYTSDELRDMLEQEEGQEGEEGGGGKEK